MKKILILTLFFINVFQIFANNYYVASNGLDTNVGTEILAWKTIQRAVNTAQAGDTVFIKQGIYNEQVIIQNSGMVNNYIVFTNFENDEVTIDGNGINWGASWNGLIDFNNKEYIEISGLSVINSDYAGFLIDLSNHISLKNNYTYNTFSSGISVWESHNIIIENNEIELACNNGGEECITVSNSYDCIVSNNNVHHNGNGANGGEGIDIKEGSHDVEVFQNIVHHLNNRLGIYADAWNLHTYNINFYQNIVHHCSESGIAIASENGGLLENINIYNNIIYYNKYGGIEIGEWSDVNFPGIKPIQNIKILHNTCYKNGMYKNGWGYGILVDNPDAKNILIRNNICTMNSAQIAIKQIDDIKKVDHNLLYGNNIAAGTLYGADSIVADPFFVDEASNNFHLNNNSNAIDNGFQTSVSFDFDGNIRPIGVNSDIGAYENLSSVAIKNLKNENFIIIYPTLLKDKLSIEITSFKKELYTIKIVNVNGEIVKKYKKEISNKISLNIDKKEFSKGVYRLLVIKENKILKNIKIIIS